ncbi:hypothetical protein [Nonomuraea salmonea]|uniref:Uncharacterized protein n=1 Tax=Nonomuraea salmonea TaxID=46181 RepID=A0ABV5P054_9ACTN
MRRPSPHGIHEEFARAYLAERRAEADRSRMIPPRSHRRVRARLADALRRLADRLEPALPPALPPVLPPVLPPIGAGQDWRGS